MCTVPEAFWADLSCVQVEIGSLVLLRAICSQSLQEPKISGTPMKNFPEKGRK